MENAALSVQKYISVVFIFVYLMHNNGDAATGFSDMKKATFAEKLVCISGH